MTKSLSRKDNHRKSLLRNLATSLVLYEEIRTTATKAKEVRPIVEHLINIAKKSAKGGSASDRKDLVSRRRLLGYFFDKKAVQKIFEILVPKYAKKTGFVKLYKIGPRLGDRAEMVILKLEKVKTEKIETPKENKEKDAEEKISTPKD